MVKLFLKLGAKSYKNINGQTPLDLAKDKWTRLELTTLNSEALHCADVNIIQLIEKGHDVNERTTIFGEPPLHKAVDAKPNLNISTIRTILDYNADVNMIDYNGWTALHHAAFKGDFEACAELIRNGANVNAYSTSIKTPLHLAANYNHPEIIHLLAQSGANLEGISNDEFLKYSTNKHSIVAENVAPLLLAAKKGNIECFELLLKLGAYFYTKDIRKWNCLHYATYCGHLNLIRLILRLDYEQNGLRNMRNTHGHPPEFLCGSLKAKLLYEEIWEPPEGMEEGEGDQQVDDMDQANEDDQNAA